MTRDSRAGASPRRVALVGAECSGKSTLAQALARQCGGAWVSESLRAFCMHHGRTPQRHEQAQVMRSQWRAEQAQWRAARARGLAWVFCDTTPMQTAAYSQWYFGDASLCRRAGVLQARYVVTLLLAPDLPWRADGPMRDGLQAQQGVHHLLQAALQTSALPWALVEGGGNTRLQRALQALAAFD